MEPSDPKNILCFGDSNTWGANPVDASRHGFSKRWPGVVRRTLGAGYNIIEEGLGGRTANWDDPLDPGRNGATYLPPCLGSHRPLDLVIVLLGTNDTKAHLNLAPETIAAGIEVLVRLIQANDCYRPGSAKPILIIAPPTLAKLTGFAGMFSGSTDKAKKLPPLYAEVAERNDCHFLDASKIIRSSDLDGIHWEGEAHETLGLAVAKQVSQSILSD